MLVSLTHNTGVPYSYINRCAGGMQSNSSICKNIMFRSYSDIIAFRKVDETLYRGGRPTPGQVESLRDLGITSIIDFSTEPFKITGYSEENAAKEIGIKYFKIPFVNFENPTNNDISKFFEIVDAEKKKNGRIFIHCYEGKDRTGLFSELYKIRYGLSDAQTSINNLIKNRYNFSENPLAMSLISEFAKNLKH